MTSNGTSSVLRPLGLAEAKMASMHELSGNTQTTSVVDLDSYLDEESLKQAVHAWLNTFQILKAVIVENEDRWFYSVKETLEVNDVFSSVTVSDLYAADFKVKDIINDVLDSSNCLIRVEYLRVSDISQSQLCFTFHHAIVDGQSIANLIEAFFNIYSSSLSPDREHLISTPLENYLRPAMQTLDRAGLNASKKSFVFSPIKHKEPTQGMKSRVSNFTHLMLDGTKWHDLKRKCKSLNCTVNTALTYAFLCSVSEVFQKDAIKLAVAVSMRNRGKTPISIEDIGCFIKVLIQEIHIPASLQRFLDDYPETLANSLSALSVIDPESDIPALRQGAAELSKLDSFPIDIAMTNHGVVKLTQNYPEFKVLGYKNLANRNGGNFAIAMHISSLKDQMQCVFTFCETLVHPELVNQLQKVFLENINALPESNFHIEGIYDEALI